MAQGHVGQEPAGHQTLLGLNEKQSKALYTGKHLYRKATTNQRKNVLKAMLTTFS